MAFGPQNFGVSVEETEAIAREKLALVGLMSHSLDVVPLSFQADK